MKIRVGFTRWPSRLDLAPIFVPLLGSPMRKLLLSAAATVLIAGPASAADLAVKAPPPGAAYIASPWDGLYIGGNLGYGETSFDFPGISLHGNGVVGGFQAGYNKQFGTFVLGLETDFDL